MQSVAGGVAENAGKFRRRSDMGSDDPGRDRVGNRRNVLRNTGYAAIALNGFGDSPTWSVRGYFWKNWTAADFSRWKEDRVHRLQN